MASLEITVTCPLTLGSTTKFFWVISATVSINKPMSAFRKLIELAYAIDKQALNAQPTATTISLCFNKISLNIIGLTTPVFGSLRYALW